MISKDEVKKLAALARIKLADEKEEEKLAQDMGMILGYVEQIKEVSGSRTDGENKEVALPSETVRNVMREDSNPHESGKYTEVLLGEAPQREGQYVKVKKIL